MRRRYTDDRLATDPHGFAPVPSRDRIPRQRAERPAHDPWDLAHTGSGLRDEERYPDVEYVPAGRDEYDDDVPDDGQARYAAEDGRPRRRATRRRAERRPRTRPEPPPPWSRSGTSVEAGPPADADPAGGPRIAAVAVPVAIGSLVAIAFGVWARVQEPTGVAVNLAGFSSGGAVKAWLATLALVLAMAQGWTGMVLSGRVGSGPTALVATVHRWSGRFAVLVTVPVAIQCLVALGWSGATPRTLVHSVLGCVFYGAFVTKMLLLRRPGVPGWVVAVSGGALLAVLTGIWLTSALWFLGASGLSF